MPLVPVAVATLDPTPSSLSPRVAVNSGAPATGPPSPPIDVAPIVSTVAQWVGLLCRKEGDEDSVITQVVLLRWHRRHGAPFRCCSPGSRRRCPDPGRAHERRHRPASETKRLE